MTIISYLLIISGLEMILIHRNCSCLMAQDKPTRPDPKKHSLISIIAPGHIAYKTTSVPDIPEIDTIILTSSRDKVVVVVRQEGQLGDG